MTIEKKERFEDHIDAEMFDFIPLDEKEVQDFRADCILKEIANLREILADKHDRMKYYNVIMTLEDIELVIKELKRIEKDLA